MPFSGVYTELAEVLRMTQMNYGLCVKLGVRGSRKDHKEIYGLQFTLYNIQIPTVSQS